MFKNLLILRLKLSNYSDNYLYFFFMQATPLGGRRVSEASGSFGERPQSAAGGPPARSSPDSLADLPSNHHQLHHLVKG